MPVAGAAGRLRRLLVLVPWIMAHPEATVPEICARFGITRDELAKEIEQLYVCGLPPFGPGDLIWADFHGDNVVIEMADYLATPSRLTRSEALALLVMGRALAPIPGVDEAESLSRALEKLADALSPEEREAAEDLAARIEVELDTVGIDLLGVLRDAAAEHRRVEITYYSQGRGSLSERVIEPLLVFSSLGHWYVAANDHASGEERLFRVDRMRDVRPTAETFEPPAGFDPLRYLDGRLFHPSPRDVEAVVDVGPEAAWLREEIPVERTEDRGDGWTRVHLRVSHLPWLAGLVLAAGGAVRVVEPQAVRDAVREAARGALARYGETV